MKDSWNVESVILYHLGEGGGYREGAEMIAVRRQRGERQRVKSKCAGVWGLRRSWREWPKPLHYGMGRPRFAWMGPAMASQASMHCTNPQSVLKPPIRPLCVCRVRACLLVTAAGARQGSMTRSQYCDALIHRITHQHGRTRKAAAAPAYARRQHSHWRAHSMAMAVQRRHGAQCRSICCHQAPCFILPTCSGEAHTAAGDGRREKRKEEGEKKKTMHAKPFRPPTGTHGIGYPIIPAVESESECVRERTRPKKEHRRRNKRGEREMQIKCQG